MTQSEMQTILDSKYDFMGTEVLKEKIGNIDFCSMIGFKVLGDKVVRTNVRYYHNTSNGQYYWDRREPDSTPDNFPARLGTFITNKISANAIKAAFVESLDVPNECAVIKAVMPTNAEKRYIINPNRSGGYDLAEIV